MKITRSLPALAAVLLLLVVGSCRRESSLELGITSVYEYQDIFGDCLGDTARGNFVVGHTLNGDSSYVEMKINVRARGTYIINSDIQNGFSFAGTGTFPDTGLLTVRIPARGTPQQAGATTLRFVHDSTYCEVIVNVTATAQGGGTCNAQVAGSYYKDTALRGTNTVGLSHTYAAAGTYTVHTDTINGYHFDGLVNITAAGSTSITLSGDGTPLATGTNNFTVRFGDGTDCGFPVTVIAATPPASGCGTVNGSYTAGTATGASNTITSSTHTYSATGTFTVQTNTVNGMSFGPATVTVTSPGATPNITLSATGTPAAAGTFTYALNFGDGNTCNVTVMVAPAGGSLTYQPLTQGSTWSYDDGSHTSGDTLLVTSGPMVTIGANSYHQFLTAYSSGDTDTTLLRKDASGTFFQNEDLNTLIDFGGSSLVNFPAGTRGEIPVVKDFMSTGTTVTSATFSGTMGGVPTNVRVTITCTNANATLTVNGFTFNNVYEITTNYEFSSFGSPFQTNPLLPSPKTWFAPNVGLVQIVAVSGLPPENGIRTWHIQ